MSQSNDPRQRPQHQRYPAPQRGSRARKHKFLTSLIALGALAGMGGILQATGQDKPRAAPASVGTVTTTAAARATVAVTATARTKARSAAAVKASVKKRALAAEPTFAYPGDSQCVIVYRGDGNGVMSWTATVTVAGELITHASDNFGNIYRHDVQVTPGPTVFTAPVSLPNVNDIGGVLYVGNTSYGCSIAPLGSS